MSYALTYSQLQNYWEIKDGVRDRIEHYNFYQNQFRTVFLERVMNSHTIHRAVLILLIAIPSPCSRT